MVLFVLTYAFSMALQIPPMYLNPRNTYCFHCRFVHCPGSVCLFASKHSLLNVPFYNRISYLGS